MITRFTNFSVLFDPDSEPYLLLRSPKMIAAPRERWVAAQMDAWAM
jgi:hypothetical protein